jgi:parallel beta-helix repeat protein
MSGTTKRGSFGRTGTLAVLSLVSALAPLRADALIRSIDCTTRSIGATLPKLGPGDTLLVTGVCNENVAIIGLLGPITVDGQGSATIAAPNPANAAISVQVPGGVTIRGFTITGGGDGIDVTNGVAAFIERNVIQQATGEGIAVLRKSFARIIGNTIRNNAADGIFVADDSFAIIDGNTIQQSGQSGIIVNRHASARIVNNTIKDSTGHGIEVQETSYARIGFSFFGDSKPSPNIVENSGFDGIVVAVGASASIFGNTIRTSAVNGVGVLRGAYAHISSNDIAANAQNGIGVFEMSSVTLGENTGTRFFELPNTSSAPNGQVGILCLTVGLATGRLGSLNGAGGATSFDSTCTNSLLP